MPLSLRSADEPFEELAPLGQREHVALGVADVLDALDVPLAADLGPDQALEPVQRVDDHRSIGVLLGVELRQGLHGLVERRGEGELGAVDLAQVRPRSG